jgi:hypothetical protein
MTFSGNAVHEKVGHKKTKNDHDHRIEQGKPVARHEEMEHNPHASDHNGTQFF